MIRGFASEVIEKLEDQAMIDSVNKFFEKYDY